MVGELDAVFKIILGDSRNDPLLHLFPSLLWNPYKCIEKSIESVITACLLTKLAVHVSVHVDACTPMPKDRC